MGWKDAPLIEEEWKSAPLVEDEAKPVTARQRTFAGLGGINRGIAGLAGLPADTGENLINLGLTGYGAIKNLLTGRKDSPPVLQGSLGGSEHIAGLLQKGGAQTTNPRPDDAASRMLNTAGTIAGGSLVPGARPVPTLAAATGGALAGETLGPQYTGLGALAPAAARQTVANVRAPSKAQANSAVFAAAGVKPSAGLVTENAFFNGVENLLSKFPGSSGVITKFRENLQRDLGAKTKTGVSAEDAGRAIERGITGLGGFLERTSAIWKQLDDAVAAKVPKGKTIIPFETTKALDELTASVPGAERSTGGLANPKLIKMKEDLNADLSQPYTGQGFQGGAAGRIPFEALRVLRTRVGSMMENSLVSGVPGGELKSLYRALSKDLEAAANQAGAGREFARQSQYWAARTGRIERVLERVLGNDKNFENIFKRFYPTDQNQATKVRATMRSLPADERKIVTNAVVDRLGRAKAGKQDETGEIFSSETFLTNWTNLSAGAKAQLFPDKGMRANLDAIVAASSKIRHGSTVFNNTSGTAGSFAAYSIYGSPIASLATWSVVPVAAAASLAGAANISARMLSNPRIVAWMAKAPTGDPQRVAAHLARLSVIYNATDDEALKSDLEQYIQSMNGEQ